MTDEERFAWRRVEELGQRVLQQGALLELDAETQAILRAGAQLVALGPEDTEHALRGVSTATTLLVEIRRRIGEGSRRLGKAMSQTEALREQGDFAGARKVLEEALAVETVPHYREQLDIQLDYLATFEAIFQSGHLEEDFHPWGQLRALALRARSGRPLLRRDDLRDFLLRTAPSLAFSEAEVSEAFQTGGGTEALLTLMLKRIDEGKQRISQALHQMMLRQEAGDLDGARQPLQEVLAVEVVPRYRHMAEEHLANLEEPPRPR
ncbi:DUSAM domain-containing protein [Pyxidicoccus sp. 3LFB2]